MSSAIVDGLVLIDAKYYHREPRAELGPGAVCLVIILNDR